MVCFISLEGIDGSGKSTHSDFIVDYFKQSNHQIIKTYEPGGTLGGDILRNLILHHEELKLLPLSELLLIFASRNELVQKIIIPSLNNKISVLSDRYIDSSYAYQGSELNINFKIIDHLFELINAPIPDITFYFDLKPETAKARLTEKKDRFEILDIKFFHQVRANYLIRAKQDSKRVKIIDANLAISTIHEQLKYYLKPLLNECF